MPPQPESQSSQQQRSAGLEGKVAIVTGASRGIGAAIARGLAARGANVIASAHAADPPDELAERLLAEGLDVHPRIADVTDPDQTRELCDWTHDTFGRIDVLVNNAGIGAVAPSETLSLELWSRVLAVNLTGPLLCSQAAARHMLDDGGGVIVNIASIFGQVGIPMRAAYAASKHGVVGLTRVLGAEWANRGIRVVAVEPAYVQTGLDEQDQRDGGYSAEDVQRRTPMGRYALPEEIAKTVCFLASDDASFITGSSIAVDGGWLAHGGW